MLSVLEDKVILMTGGGSPLAAAIEESLLEAGATVYTVGDDGSTLSADPGLAQRLHEQFGRIDGVINYGGVRGGALAQAAVPYLKITRGAVVNLLSFRERASARRLKDLAQQWSLEKEAYGIRVSTVVTRERPARLDPVVKAVLFLLSDQHEGISGLVVAE